MKNRVSASSLQAERAFGPSDRFLPVLLARDDCKFQKDTQERADGGDLKTLRIDRAVFGDTDGGEGKFQTSSVRTPNAFMDDELETPGVCLFPPVLHAPLSDARSAALVGISENWICISDICFMVDAEMLKYSERSGT